MPQPEAQPVVEKVLERSSSADGHARQTKAAPPAQGEEEGRCKKMILRSSNNNKDAIALPRIFLLSCCRPCCGAEAEMGLASEVASTGRIRRLVARDGKSHYERTNAARWRSRRRGDGCRCMPRTRTRWRGRHAEQLPLAATLDCASSLPPQSLSRHTHGRVTARMHRLRAVSFSF